MKRLSIISIFAVVLMAMPTKSPAQDTIFGVFQNYYYNWYDYYEHGIVHEGVGSCLICGGATGLPAVWAYTNLSTIPGFDCELDKYVQEIAIEMHPDSALHVVGITIPVDSSVFYGYMTRYMGHVTGNAMRLGIMPADITLHLNVYNKNMSLIYTQSKRLLDLDTTRFIEHGVTEYPFYDYHPMSHHQNFIPHYDFFFDTTLVLTDTFFVSETMTHSDDTTIIYPCIHIISERHGWGGTSRLLPWEKRLYRETLDDTVWQEEEYGWHQTGIFPIIVRDWDTCPQVGNVELYKGSSTQFFLKWGRSTNHYDWQVSYGPLGIAPEDGTMLTFTQPQSSLITVDPDSQYVAYVRARCRFARDEWGPWSYPVNIWLNGSNGIGSVQRVPDFSLTPNPASGTVTVGGFEGEGAVEIVDMAGRVSGQWPVAGGKRTIDVSRLPAGSYVVRLTTAEGTASRMLQVE